MKIDIITNGKTISVESDNAGVPDVTQNAGPDVMKLADDAQKPASDKEAEFDSNVPETQAKTEEDDKVQEAEKANEAFGIAALLKKTDPKVLAKVKRILSKESDEPEAPAEPVAEQAAPEAPAEPVAEPAAEEGVGEVTNVDGTTIVQTNGIRIKIEDDSSAPEAPAEPVAEPAAPEAPAEPEHSTDNVDPTADDAQTSIESFFANLNLNDL